MMDKIEQMASEKEFDQLNSAEKTLVLSFMPKEEYDQIRRIILTAGAMDASIAAPKRLRSHLLAQYPKSKGVKVNIWLALGILATGWCLMWQYRPVRIREKVVPVVALKTDTVWVERIKWREKVVYKKRYTPSLTQEPIAVAPVRDQTFIPETELIQTPLNQQHLGTSLGDTPELLSFFTQGDQGK